MPWVIVSRRLGRAGDEKSRLARQRQWDQKYGKDMWLIGYVVNDEFVAQERAIDTVYHQSYAEHFRQHPEDLKELLQRARLLRNPHAEATGGVDLQIPAIESYLRSQNLELMGSEIVDIGSWQGRQSHALSVRLSPLHIHCSEQPRLTLESWWQKKKCLAIWE